MIDILDFSWRGFTLVATPNATARELAELARQKQLSPFVFHDPLHRSSALVLPDAVTYAVGRLDIPYDEPAVPSGVLTLLREDQITVRRYQPASRVARLARERDAKIVVVVDEYETPVGLFVPSVVVERLPGSSMITTGSSSSLRQAVQQMVSAGDLVGAIESIEKEHTGFHSERLNLDAPDPYVCEDHGKPHIQSRCPCDVHPSANCGRRRAG
jgi:hypothetical protein